VTLFSAVNLFLEIGLLVTSIHLTHEEQTVRRGLQTPALTDLLITKFTYYRYKAKLKPLLLAVFHCEGNTKLSSGTNLSLRLCRKDIVTGKGSQRHEASVPC